MTFALSYHPDVPALLAQPRLFIGPQIPGYTSPSGSILLPLTLDGRMTDTAIRFGDNKALGKYIERMEDRFVCVAPRLDIYKSQPLYEDAVHPKWLTGVVDWINDTYDRYEKIYAEHPLQRMALRVVQGQMSALAPLFSACLYLGSADIKTQEHYLHAHDLALYGKPVDAKSDNLHPVLDLLEAFFVAYEQTRMGLPEKIVVRRRGQTVSEHDVANLNDTHGHFVDFALREGAILSLPRDQVRLQTRVNAGPNGNVNPAQLSGFQPHSAYLAVQKEILGRSSVFLGCLLLLHYDIDGCLMEAFHRRLDAVSCDRLGASREHLQFVLENEMHELGHNLSRADEGFEGRCLLQALQSLRRIS